jgi:SnoaL-like domain
MARQVMVNQRINRRAVFRTGMAGTALGVAALVLPRLSVAAAQVNGPSCSVGDVYQLQAAFHRAKTTQDLDLMMSLWADEATFTNQGDLSSPYIGSARLRTFWQNSGSFKNRRLSLVPSFKTQIDLRSDDEAWLYFECHDVGDYDQPTRTIAGDTFLAGTVKRLEGNWVFWDMTAGSSSPLSMDHYYFP